MRDEYDIAQDAEEAAMDRMSVALDREARIYEKQIEKLVDELTTLRAANKSMLNALETVLPVIEAELEQRECGGPAEYQEVMRRAVAVTRAAMAEARGVAPPDPGPEPCAEPLELQLDRARAEGARRERLATQRLMSFLMLAVTAETLVIGISLLWWLL